MSRHYLPRLPREHYQGDAVVLWTLPINNRATGWLTDKFHTASRELMFHAAAREGLLCPIYCLMPDHIHLVWMGLRLDSDQLNGMSFLRTYLEPELQSAKFQVQSHDHVLRESDRTRNSFSSICSYITQNPVRANLNPEHNQWPFTAPIIPGYPKLNPHDPDYWPTFWRIHAKLRHPNASHIRRPPI